jgi:hypothetical protein
MSEVIRWINLNEGSYGRASIMCVLLGLRMLGFDENMIIKMLMRIK